MKLLHGTTVPSTGCPGASRWTNGASCADDHIVFSGGVIMDRTIGFALVGAPSAEGPSVVAFSFKGSSEWGVDDREIALTTH